MGEDGVKRHVFAQKVGKDWKFFERPRRKGRDIEWQELPHPPLLDWLELLDSLERRTARDLHPPKQVERLRQMIRDRFPEHRFE